MRVLIPLVVLVPAAHAQNLLVNGGFEQAPAPGSFSRFCPPSAQITGWTVTRDCVDYCGSLWTAAEGSRSVDLDGNVGDAGAVAQTFATAPGVLYRVTFAMAGNTNSGPPIKRMFVTAASFSEEYAFDITGRSGANMGWTQRSFAFAATEAVTTLEFRSTTSPAGWGAVIDDVRVACAADFNGDGFLDFFDYADYVACFETGACAAGTSADFNGDGFADFFDYADFVAAFESGC